MRGRERELTGFQERAPYSPSIDLQTDFVMVYGVDDTMPQRIEQWREKGYRVHLMTGIAWGQYQDYLYGEYDGRNHWDEAQKRRDGTYILHGKDVPYMVPTISFAEYLIEKIKVAVDTGVEAIHLEEPEFWADGGYSEAFKREWEIYYKEPWRPPHESPDNQYRASKLKAYLYARCLDRLCGSLKEYAKVKYQRDLRFYVPTHSLINYTQWRIVSPESRLLDIPGVDGYIAQIWTGTSRTPNVYEGVRKERTFETAFLEYGIMQELTRGSDRRMWFLHDPIEDNPNHTWEDYRTNYFKTVVASLFHPKVSRYEVAPWPNRIFNREYPKQDGTGREGIPSDYACVLLTIMNTLRDMEQDKTVWGRDNLEVGLLLADSGMFQRFYMDLGADGVNEPDLRKKLVEWNEFYGLALPLLKHGVAVRPVQLDNIARFPDYLNDYRVLLLSYEFMKPESPYIHNAIAQWVLDGGILIYVGDDSDPYHNIRNWWTEGRRKYVSPREHLFECLGVKSDEIKAMENGESLIKRVGKGILAYLNVNPVECAYDRHKAQDLRDVVKNVLKMSGYPELEWKPKNHFILHRGPYTIVAVMDESVDEQPVILEGSYVDLFDAKLTIRNGVEIKAGELAFLYDLNSLSASTAPKLIAASSRIDELKVTRNDKECGSGKLTIDFMAKGPERVPGVARIYSTEKVTCVKAYCDNQVVDIKHEWDDASNTVVVFYDNNPDGIRIILTGE